MSPVYTELVRRWRQLRRMRQFNVRGEQVLDFARRLTAPKGTPGRELLRFAGAIDPGEIELISRAIQEGCEAVHSNG
jgi:hypothetical protein